MFKTTVAHRSTSKRSPISHFPPIRWSKKDVSVMVRVRIHDDLEQFSQTTGASIRQIRAIAAGRHKPTAAILDYFNLKKSGEGFIWHVL